MPITIHPPDKVEPALRKGATTKDERKSKWVTPEVQGGKASEERRGNQQRVEQDSKALVDIVKGKHVTLAKKKKEDEAQESKLSKNTSAIKVAAGSAEGMSNVTQQSIKRKSIKSTAPSQVAPLPPPPQTSQVPKPAETSYIVNAIEQLLTIKEGLNAPALQFEPSM